MFRNWLASPHSGLQELLGLTGLYAVYELVRGFGSDDLATAFAHTDAIVGLERHLGVFAERSVQQAADGVSGLPALLGVLYVLLHFAGTTAVVVWVYRKHPEAYPRVRTTLVVATALALVGYVLYPAAPPRLSDFGFVDTVTTSTGLNLSSDLLGALYNPVAAVPSLHFGYAVIAGLALATLARNPLVRVAGALYPALMLFVIVATGNHFFFDAAMGGLVVVVAWLASGVLAAPTRRAHGRVAPTAVAG